MALDVSYNDRERFRVGQLVRLKAPFVVSDHVDLWSGPPFSYDTGLPIRQIADGELALVIDVAISSYKVIVDGTIGWVDKQDMGAL